MHCLLQVKGTRIIIINFSNNIISIQHPHVAVQYQTSHCFTSDGPHKALAKQCAQLKPTRAKIPNQTCIDGWPNGTANHASLQENHSIFWLWPCSQLTITKQHGLTRLELAEVTKRWKTWLEVGENLNLIKFKPTRPTPTNSSQLWCTLAHSLC